MKTQCYFNNFLPSYKCVIDNGDVNMRPPNLKLSIMYIFGLMHKKLEFFYFSSLKTNFTVDCCAEMNEKYHLQLCDHPDVSEERCTKP